MSFVESVLSHLVELGGYALTRTIRTCPPGTERLLEQVKGARIWSLQRGMGVLPAALRRWLEHTGMVRFRVGEECVGLTHAKGGRVTVRLSGGDVLEADHVVSALPTRALARVLRDADADSAALCSQMPVGGIVVANYMFRGSKLGVDGFGYLVRVTLSCSPCSFMFSCLLVSSFFSLR